MQQDTLKVTLENNELVIRLPINNPLRESNTKKTLVVASTYGNKVTHVQVDGQNVTVGVNAYIKRPKA